MTEFETTLQAGSIFPIYLASNLASSISKEITNKELLKNRVFYLIKQTPNIRLSEIADRLNENIKTIIDTVHELKKIGMLL